MNDKQKSLLDFVEFLSSSSSEEEELLPEIEEEIIIENESESVDEINAETFDATGTMGNTTKKKKLAKDERNNRQKKNEIVALIKQLQTHVISLEKEKKSQLYKRINTEGKTSDYKELETIEVKQNRELNNEKKRLSDDINKISTKIDKFKRDKENIQKCGSCIEKLRITMEDIESHIMQFKERQGLMYEEISLEEKSLTQDIDAYVKKFNQWSKQMVEVKQYKNKFEENNKGIPLPKEVEDFEVFLHAMGGHQGDWDDIDHQAFLKLRKQVKNDAKLIALAEGDIPTKTKNEIVSHLAWYREYCFLRNNKRQAIKRWKGMKEVERKGLLSNVAQTLDTENERNLKKEQLLEREREERFEKLKQWKRQKAEEEAMRSKEIDKEEDEREKLKQIMEERKRVPSVERSVKIKEKFETKLKVERYQEQKREEHLIIQRAKEEKLKQEKHLLTVEEKSRIKERNEKIATSRKDKIMNRRFQEEEKERRLEQLKQKVAVNVKRDPSRLYQLTKGWKHRKEDKDNDAKGHGTNVQLMPHRAVPSWRQGVS